MRSGHAPLSHGSEPALTGGRPRPRVGGVNRAIGLLTVGAFLALVIGVLAAGGPVAAVVLGAVFPAVGTAGFASVARSGRRRWAVAYVALQLPLAFVTFTLDPGAGATLLLVVLVCQCVLLLPLPATAVVIALVPGTIWITRPIDHDPRDTA